MLSMMGTALLSLPEIQKLSRGDDLGSYTVDQQVSLWQNLVITIQNTHLSEKHITAVCNAFCFVARYNAKHGESNFRNHIYSDRYWEDLLNAAHTAFSAGKSKPALQILDTLVYLADTSVNQNVTIECIRRVIARMLEIVLTNQPEGSLKEACIVLSVFLRKLSDFVSVADVLEATFRDSSEACMHNLRDKYPSVRATTAGYALVLSLVQLVANPSCGIAATKLLTHLCLKVRHCSTDDFVALTNQALLLYATNNREDLDTITREILPSILLNKIAFDDYLAKQVQNIPGGIEGLVVNLALLQYGRQRGFVDETEIMTVLTSMFRFSKSEHVVQKIPSVFRDVLGSCSPTIRVKGLALLIYSKSPKTKMPAGWLSSLGQCLPLLHDDPDAFERGEIISTLRNLFTRLNQSFKQICMLGQESTVGKTEYEQFAVKYLEFLESELSLHKSYPRHILALAILQLAGESAEGELMALSSGLRISHIVVSTSRLLLDPFADVRQRAQDLLRTIGNTQGEVLDPLYNKLQISICLHDLSARTNRADHADSLGRALSLQKNVSFEKLEVTIQEATQVNITNLANKLDEYVQYTCTYSTASSFPLHGYLTCLVHTISSYPVKPYHSDIDCIIRVCHRIWMLSKSILCIDSPEVEHEEEEISNSGPKDLLAYTWRALRDSNLVLQAILLQLEKNATSQEAIGDMVFEQLSQLRHRGAFSTVAQTAVLVCEQARRGFDHLLENWFAIAMIELEHQADKLTRRSAGLPAMFIAILHPTSAPKFQEKLKSLVSVANMDASSGTKRLPQVHALNCIKDIMMSSRFRSLTGPLVNDMIQLAIRSMRSLVWSVKNCGLMLLRACIARLDPDAGQTLSSQHASSLGVVLATHAEIALSLIHHDGSLGGGSESVFAGLDLVSRLRLNNNTRTQISESISQQLCHPLWHVRTRAARLLVELQVENLDDLTLNLRNSFSAQRSNNECHGWILAIHATLDAAKLKGILPSLENVFWCFILTLEDVLSRSHSILLASWLEALNKLGKILHRSQDVAVQGYSPFEILRRVESYSYDVDVKASMTLFAAQTQIDTDGYGLLQFSNGIGRNNNLSAYVLRNLETPSTVAESRREIILLTYILRFSLDPEVQSLALRRLTACLKLEDGWIHDRLMSDIILYCSPKIHMDREVLNAGLPPFMAVCRKIWDPLCFPEKYENARASMEQQACAFVKYMRFAADDIIDEPTRMAVMEAFMQLKGVSDVGRMLQNAFSSQQQCNLLCILYDLLNDDDQEIREKAAEITMNVVVPKSDTTQLMPVCPLASRRVLLQHLSNDVILHNLLRTEALQRVIGGSGDHTESISEQILLVVEASNDLFIEEKQNLYLDEIAEITDWSEVMRQNNWSLDHASYRGGLDDWIREGIDTIIQYMQPQQDNSLDIFGIIMVPDLLIILFRLVTVTKLWLEQKARMGAFDKELVTENENLYRQCIAKHIPCVVLNAFYRSQNYEGGSS